MNMKVKSTLASAALIGASFLSLVTPAFANHKTWSDGTWDDVQSTTERAYNQRLNDAEARHKSVKARIDSVACSALEKRIDNKLDYYYRMHDTWHNRYQKHKDNLLAFLDRLDARGYDTSHAREDADYLEETMIKKTDDDLDVLRTKLEATQNYNCGSSEGQFKAAALAANDQLLVVHKDGLDIKQYWLSIIRPDIEAVKAQKPNSAPSATPGV